MDKAINDKWESVGKITSTRDVLPEEKIIAYAFANGTGKELESVRLAVKDQRCGQYTWPYDFSVLINSQAKFMRAGVRGADGIFEGKFSEHLNTLWCNDKSVRLFTTIGDLDNWAEVATLRSAEGLSFDGTSCVEIRVQSADAIEPCETLIFFPALGRHTQYLWTIDLCRYVNQNSLFIRAGEKASEMQSFDCLGSSYRNKFWVPVGSELSVTYEIIELPVIRPMGSLSASENDVLPDMSGFAPDGLGTADNGWFSPGYLLADRDLTPGEKLHAWLIKSADGQLADFVEFLPDASDRSKTKWPSAFARAINFKAKQMRAGGWSDDGQFSALEKSATSADFAGQDAAFKAGVNRLWHYNDGSRAVTTAAFRTNWVRALSLANYGLDAAATFWVQVRDITSQYLYETHLFTPDAKQPLSTQTLCEQINRDGKMLRAGIWDIDTSLIKPGHKNNALWIPQCSDLAVTMMAAEWWSQTTVSAARDLQEGESIYCYVWDDFSSVELLPAMCFTPKAAAQRKKNAWLHAWAGVIKASALAGYVRLGSSAPCSDDPGENATQASLWQIGAPLRVFTTEPSPDNWLSVTGPLAELYEDNKTAVKIELRNGLTQGVLQAITFTPSDAVIKASDKDLWLREFYTYLASQLVPFAYMRIGETADANRDYRSGSLPSVMRMWVPRSSGIVVAVEQASGSAGVVVSLPAQPEMINTSDLKYTFTAQLVNQALVATTIAVMGIQSAEFKTFEYGKLDDLSDDVFLFTSLLESRDDTLESKVDPLFQSAIQQVGKSIGVSEPLSFEDGVSAFINYRRSQFLIEGAWGELIEKLSDDDDAKKYISKHEQDLRELHDVLFSGSRLWYAGSDSSSETSFSLMPIFGDLPSGNQLIVYGGPSEPLFALSLQALASRIRVLAISSLPEYLSTVFKLQRDSMHYRSVPVGVKTGIAIDLYVPDDVVLSGPVNIGRIGQVSPDGLWPSGRALTMSFRKEKLAIPDSPLCADYGNTYRSEVFDVSGQNTTGVDPRTGLFNAHYPLALLMGMEGKGPLSDLTLHYSALRANEAGLGDGWAFNFSSYETRSRLITLSTGQTITLTPEDIARLRSKTVLNNRNCRISATFLAGGDARVTDSIETLTLEFPSGAKELLSLPVGDKQEPYASTVSTVLAKLNEAKTQIHNSKAQDKPHRNSTAGIAGEVFAWVVWPVGLGITINNTVLYNKAWARWNEEWAEKLPELLGPIDKEIVYWRRESRQLLPTTITSMAGGSLQLEWTRRKGQFLLANVLSNNKTLLAGSYSEPADVDGNKVNKVTFNVWSGTDEAYDVTLHLQNYLLKSIVRSDQSGGVLQSVRYGYSGDPTLDRVLTSIEESDGSLEVVSYERHTMKFPSGIMNKPPLPRVSRHIVQPGADQASLITFWTYSSNNYLGANSTQAFSRLDDAAVKEGAAYVYDSTATETDGIVITRTWNGLHLQVKEQETAPSGVGKTTQWSFASADPASPLFGLVTSIDTTYQELELAKESTK